MHDRDDDLKPGMRVRLSALGRERSPRLYSQTGVIVGMGVPTFSVRVLIDGRKMPITLHVNYIEPE